MRVYIDDDNDAVSIVQSVASASTMISSLAGRCKEYVLSKFPKNFFKHIYIDTSETVTQQLRNDRYNNTANKIPYPSMTISPEISLDNPIGGMDKSLHMSSPNIYLRKDISRTYNKLVIDPDEKFSIYYTSDYITTNFNFKLTTNSFIQNTDMAFYLKSRVQENMFQYLNGRHLQTEIPKSFIKMIADLKGWDMNNADEMDELRLYLIGTSKSEQAIQKRINMSTGKQCFFFDEHVDFLTLFRDLDCPSTINRDGQVEGEYTITFTLQVSTWIPNAFILKLNKNIIRKHRISLETLSALQTDDDQQDSGILSVSVFSNNLLAKKETITFTDNDNNEQIGHLVYSDNYTYDVSSNNGYPPISILEKMPNEFKMVHTYAINKLNLDLSSLVYPLVYSPNGKLDLSRYSFDPETLTYDFNDTLSTDISINLYVNRTLYESIKKAILMDTNFFADNYLTSIIANIGGEKISIVVKSFENNRALYSSLDDKCLRVKTAYGIGYISLVDDDNKDGYKICIGVSEDGNPIIKKFELTDVR